MSLLKVAKYITIKYGAGEDAERLEASIRSSISMLWVLANEKFSILAACADANPKKPTSPNDTKAVAGAKFCKQLLTLINYLQVHRKDISLVDLQKALSEIVELIDTHKDVKINDKGKISDKGKAEEIQFPHVSELIFNIMPHSTVRDRAIRDQQYPKARTGLSRILSVSLTMLQNISQLEVAAPQKFEGDTEDNKALPDRFSPQRGSLSVYDIISFIREHGDEYGLSSLEDWTTVFRDDPKLKEEMTTVINAVNRGHLPLGSADIKMEIARILKEYEQRKSTNATLFEETEEGI
jgi:hypothetical protein